MKYPLLHFDATLVRPYRVTARIVRHDLRFDRLILDTGATSAGISVNNRAAAQV
jgi:hypothetical protein